jgi:anti-sigma factor RsiW
MNEAVDIELTALLDGQLAESERSDLFRRLAADSSLQARFDALAGVRGSLDAVFTGMLAGAPTAGLQAALPARAPQRFARARLAAGFVIAALVGAAFAALVTMNLGEKEDWSKAVVDYMRLYTPETFAGLNPDAALESALVTAVGGRLGIQLTPEKLNLSGLSFKTAFVLAYDGSPLGEFAFTDGSGTPYLFCVLADSSGPKPLRQEKRGGYALATWAHDGRRFLVLGPSPKVIDDWAHMITGA